MCSVEAGAALDLEVLGNTDIRDPVLGGQDAGQVRIGVVRREWQVIDRNAEEACNPERLDLFVLGLECTPKIDAQSAAYKVSFADMW